MAQKKDKGKSRIEKLRHTYRLVIMNNDTFEEIGSYKLSLLNVYVALSTIAVVVAAAVLVLVIFTPLKRYIPGLQDTSNDDRIVELYQDLTRLRQELNTQRAYSENFRRMLTGEVKTAEDIPEEITQDFNDTTLQAVERSMVDEELRQEVDLMEIGEIARQSTSTNLSPRGMPLEQMYLASPLSGELSANFLPEKKHFGVDVLAPKNTAIKAIADGYVFLSDWTVETGNTIGVQHANNVISFYKHNSVLLKEAGDYVRAGEAVAIIGNTGTLSDGPHLHFELWYRGAPVDPTEYINF